MDLSVPSALRRPELTTAQLAQRVSIPAGTLRMWEARYGFPVPQRLPSGHRRYSSRDADLVREVLRLRAAGISLPAAILATRAHDVVKPTSMFARIRDRCPSVPTLVLERGPLLELTRAIEDEYLSRGRHGVVIGSFQRVENFRRVESRWRDLGRAADLTVALADFDAFRRTREGVCEIPVAQADPLAREWSLLLHSPDTRGCLAAWELPPDGRRPGSRRFEVLLTTEPAVAHAAAGAAAELLHDLAPEVATEVLETIGDMPAPSARELQIAATLGQRTLDYLLGRQPADG